MVDLTEELGESFTLVDLHCKCKGRRAFPTPTCRSTVFVKPASSKRLATDNFPGNPFPNNAEGNEKMDLLLQFLTNTGYYLADYRHFLMWGYRYLFCLSGHRKKIMNRSCCCPSVSASWLENVPFFKGFGLGIYEPNSVLHYLYFWRHHRCFIHRSCFLGLGAMTDFSSLLARPKLMLLGGRPPRWAYSLPCSALWPWDFCPKRPHRLPSSGVPTVPHPSFLTAKTGASPDWPHCHRRLLLHGADTDHSAPHHEVVDD